MNPDLRGSAAHVMVDDLAAPVLEAADHHHLAAVLRLRAGEIVTATDGSGRWARCRWQADGSLGVDGEVVVEPPRPVAVTVATAVPKGDRAEWMVEKLTEVGVGRILLVTTARDVVRWRDDRRDKAMSRLRAVARSAAMQSRRTRLPVIEGPVELAGVLAGVGVAVADPDGPYLGQGVSTVVIGPEGGFSPAELSLARSRVSLGPTILRVETAAVLAGHLLVNLTMTE